MTSEEEVERRVGAAEDAINGDQEHEGCERCNRPQPWAPDVEFPDEDCDTLFGPDARGGDRARWTCEACGRTFDVVLVKWPENY